LTSLRKAKYQIAPTAGLPIMPERFM